MAGVFYTLKGFRSEAHLINYMAGTGTDAHEDKINVALGQEANMIVIAYLADKTEMIEVKYSLNLENSYSKLALGEMLDTAAKNAYWIKKEIVAEKLSAFNYTEKQIEFALAEAVPLTKEKAEMRASKAPSKQQLKQYDENYQYLASIAAVNDKATINAIEKLCNLLLEIDADAVKIYNQSIYFNKGNNLSAGDYDAMIIVLRKTARNLKSFLNTNFTTAEELTAVVNNNYVDPSSNGAVTKFVINYPFQKLSYQKRKEIILLY